MEWFEVRKDMNVFRYKSLNEDMDDIHIYLDEKTGDYYYFDGEKLVKLGGKPRLGNRGNSDLQRQEDKERDEIAKEEGQQEESEEDAHARMTALDKDLSNPDLLTSIENDVKQRKMSSAEKAKSASNTQMNKDFFAGAQISAPGLAAFKGAIRQFISNEIVYEGEKSSYQKFNKTYANSPLLKPGKKQYTKTTIPSVFAYFDKSGSFNSNDIQRGKEAFAALNYFADKGLVKLNIFYFGDGLNEDPSKVKTYDTQTYLVAEHIRTYKPDNVIIMTDGDGDYYKQEQYGPKVIVKGHVWWIWKQTKSNNFKNAVVGRKGVREFML